MIATHEIWLRGELFKLFDNSTNTVLDLDGSYFLGGAFTKPHLEELGYVLKDIVVSLENE